MVINVSPESHGDYRAATVRVWGRAGSKGGRNKPKKGDRQWKNDSVCQSPQLGSAPLLFTVDNLH